MNNISYNLIKDFVLHQKYSKKREDGEFLLVSSPRLEMLFLNEVANDFYSKIDGSKSLQEIINLLLEEYEIDKETLINDIVNLVRDFQWKGILELKESKI